MMQLIKLFVQIAIRILNWILRRRNVCVRFRIAYFVPIMMEQFAIHA